MESSAEVRVRYAETDQMKFAHHSNYIIWFELGRIEFMRVMGVSYAEMEKEGVLLPVLEVNAQYIKPAYLDDLLQVRVRVAPLKKARVIFLYEVYRSEEKICSGHSVHAFMNGNGRPIKPPKEFAYLVEKAVEPA